MKYEDYKQRRVEIVPPLPLKAKIDKLSQGKRSEFILDAIREKIARIEENNKKLNSVTAVLG